MTGLALDPEKFASFIRDPKTTIENSGLSGEEAAVLEAGDQNRIYGALSFDL